MNYEEKAVAMSRKVVATYYQERLNAAKEKNQQDDQLKKIVTPDEMPWETCPQGTIKHLVNKEMGTRTNTVDIYMQVIPEGGRSGKHRHMDEEYMFILEGKGYSLHWDVDMELGEQYYWKAEKTPSRWEWEQGDSVYIPPNTIHQHFNADPNHPVRFIGAESRIMADMGLDDLEQLENAPEYKKE